jgi:hypothetical protein
MKTERFPPLTKWWLTQHPNIKDEIRDHFAYAKTAVVEARVLADSIDEAISKARELYDKWIDDQLGVMDDAVFEDFTDEQLG